MPFEVRIPVSDGELPEYLGYTVGRWAVAVIVGTHDVNGMRPDLRDQAGRLASANYLAVVPDLFSCGTTVI